jgi:hypothetical protein
MSKNTGRDKSENGGWLNHAGVHLAVMALVMAFLFLDSFKAGFVTFSNDSPLGGQIAQWDYLFDNLSGGWQPLNWFGNEAIANRPTVSIMAGIVTQSAIVYQKFFTPFALWLLGACAYFCFRQLGFRSPVCFIAGMAAMLNMNAFSNACWGLPYWQVTRAMAFLAFGLAVCSRIRMPWIRYILAGAAIGMGVMEGYDIGAIFSIFVAALVFAYLDATADGPVGERFLKGGLAVGIMAVAAAVIATHALVALVNTQVKGVAGTGQDEKSKTERWGFATQWSLPKAEVLRFVIPGLFGYRMDEPDGGQYWGRVGENPNLEQIKKLGPSNPQAGQLLKSPSTFRYSGSGEHIGVLVVLIAAWAFVMSFFKGRSSYSDRDRHFIWCVAGLAMIALLLSFGRYGFLYRAFFELPYASTVRNPIKFTQPMHMAICLLFAYGLNDLWVRFVERRGADQGKAESFGSWWRSLQGLDRGWFYGCGALVAISLFSLVVYASKRAQVEGFMAATAIGTQAAKVVFDFSLVEIVLFLFFLVCSIASIALVQRGTFTGRQAKWAVVFLAAILLADMCRSNAHWIRHVDYKQKYASNLVFEKLAEKPHEGRVTAIMNQSIPALQILQQVYRVNWLHQHFPYFKIQSLDVSQEPRVANEKLQYQTAIQAVPLRYWQLTNTRYLLAANLIKTQQGDVRYVDVLNQQLDPQLKRFRVEIAFDFRQEPGNTEVLVIPNPDGQNALIEFTGALPRAALFTNWETEADDTKGLARLKDPGFDPLKTVLLAESIGMKPGDGSDGGAVTITQYDPKEVVIEVESTTDAMLLLNDRYHPDWRAYIDGKQAPVVRANVIARAVSVPAGKHRIEFRFEPVAKSLYVSVFGIIAVVGLMGYVAYGGRGLAGRSKVDEVKPESAPEVDSEIPDDAKPSESDRSASSKIPNRKGKRSR